MQFFFFCLFTIICSYSLVISAPVNQTVPDSKETKQQKATAIASRLLKELAGEQNIAHHQELSSNKNENQDAIVPAPESAVEKVQSHIVKSTNDIHNDDDDDNDDDDVNNDDELDFTPTLDDLFEFYGDKFAQAIDDNDSSSEGGHDSDYILPISEQQLLRYLDEQEENDSQLASVIHTPVMDDSIMTAEDHRRRRRRSIY